jgi:hypothetical protein
MLGVCVEGYLADTHDGLRAWKRSTIFTVTRSTGCVPVGIVLNSNGIHADPVGCAPLPAEDIAATGHGFLSYRPI